jgi:hypothetical protein
MEDLYKNVKHKNVSITGIIRGLNTIELTNLPDIELRQGLPFISLLINNYGCDSYIKLLSTIRNRDAVTLFFEKDFNVNHPLERCFVLGGLRKAFYMINEVYDRDFDLLSCVKTIRGTSILESVNGNVLDKLLSDFNVCDGEFDYSIPV